MDKNLEAQAWLAFASAAVAGYEMPEDIEHPEELVQDVVDISVQIADAMVGEFRERYGKKPKAAAKKRAVKRAAREVEDDEDDEIDSDDDDEDDDGFEDD